MRGHGAGAGVSGTTYKICRRQQEQQLITCSIQALLLPFCSLLTT